MDDSNTATVSCFCFSCRLNWPQCIFVKRINGRTRTNCLRLIWTNRFRVGILSTFSTACDAGKHQSQRLSRRFRVNDIQWDPEASPWNAQTARSCILNGCWKKGRSHEVREFPWRQSRPELRGIPEEYLRSSFRGLSTVQSGGAMRSVPERLREGFLILSKVNSRSVLILEFLRPFVAKKQEQLLESMLTLSVAVCVFVCTGGRVGWGRLASQGKPNRACYSRGKPQRWGGPRACGLPRPDFRLTGSATSAWCSSTDFLARCGVPGAHGFFSTWFHYLIPF